jgi:regulator of protease activity HflC (stomatin/prohibitin superfamily)
VFLFIIGILFLVAALAAHRLWPVSEAGYQEEPKVSKWKTPALIALVALGLLSLVTANLAIVGTKKVGVVTTFNKPVGNLDNGLHLVWFWQKVHEMDGAIQTDNFLCGRNAEEGHDGGIDVRIGNQSVACLDVTLRWRIRQDASEDLYRDYRGFDHVRESLVVRDLNQSLNDVFVDYNPLANVNQDTPTSGPSLEELSKRTHDAMVARVGKQIEILSVFIPIVHHDKQTQTKINQYQAAKADTRIATQKIQTALKEAEANKALRSSISNDPNVLVSKCLDLVKTGVALPAGFSCWPGGGGAVVVPSANK